MSNSWFGFKVIDANVASIQTTLKGCGKARLDYGNCFHCFSCDSSNYDYVHVRLNGVEISRAANNNQELSKTVEFDFTDGNTVELYEDGLSAIKLGCYHTTTMCGQQLLLWLLSTRRTVSPKMTATTQLSAHLNVLFK